MSEKKDTMIKDAIILCLITLILGAVLAGVYAITKGPIDEAQAKANNEACAAVAVEGDEVQGADAEALKTVTQYLESHDLAGAEVSDGDTLSNYVEVSEVHPTSGGGTVYLAAAKKGYGGAIDFALGVDPTGLVTGISITSQSETAGLGANCVNEDWQNSFKAKKLPANPADNMYNKNEETESQVQALSGATVTSRAVTNAVKGLLFATTEGGTN